MNWSLGHFSSNACGILDLLGLDLIAIAEDLVEGQQGSRHAAAAAEEVAPGAALTPGRLLADLGQPRPHTPSARPTAAAARTPRWRQSATGSAEGSHSRRQGRIDGPTWILLRIG